MPTSKTVTPSEIRLAVEWLAANANGVSLVDWEPRSQTLLIAADQIEAMASVGIRQERKIERLTLHADVAQKHIDAITNRMEAHEKSEAKAWAQYRELKAQMRQVETSAPHRTDSRLAGDIEYCLTKLSPTTDVYAILTEVMKDLRVAVEPTAPLPGELEQLRRIDKAAREYVENRTHGNYSKLCDALFSAIPPECTCKPVDTSTLPHLPKMVMANDNCPLHAVNGPGEQEKT